MIRKLLLPALATALLAGCMTSGYQYRGGSGDYYYGQPSTQYRYYGAPYGSYGYGYPGGWSGSFGYGYGYPYGYYGYGGYGGYPYYPPYPYRPPVVIVRPGGGGHDHGNNNGGNDPGDSGGNDTPPVQPVDRPRPPWRDLDSLRDGQSRRDPTIHQPPPRRASTPMQTPQRLPASTPMRAPQPLPASGGSRRSTSPMAEMIQRTGTDRDKRRKTAP